ncbi:hypothetical protein [Gorillibacterium timonense]|uniref:hypothetical protein n=1 Tax=Gorillibacterium timonense TaxID=1689269 RepID=UPI00071DF2A3|nr:hypothetical protein [Gorillibacterium timonense]
MMAILGAITFGFAVIIYLLLAFGFPFGEFAFGGQYRVLPTKLRWLCGFSIFIQLFAVLIILQTGKILPLLFSLPITRGICFFFAGYLTINVIMNLLSKSKKERLIVGPFSFITALCYWITAIE